MLTGDENQAIIKKSDQDARKIEKLAEVKAEAYKRFPEKEKKNKQLVKRKKVTVREDTVKARIRPAPVRGRKGEEKGELAVVGERKHKQPKIIIFKK